MTLTDYVMKTCTICNIEKPTSEFANAKAAKDGLFPYCKLCDKERTAKYREKNHEKLKVRQKKYNETNRELINKKARDRYAADPKTAYEKRKIQRRVKDSFCSPELYAELLRQQNSCCGICGKSEKDNGKELSADHCHDKKKMRGLLCQSCNLMLGYAKDNTTTLLKAIGYLKQHL